MPGKALLWGMAVSQWMAIFIIGGIFLIILVIALSIAFQQNQEINKQNTNTDYQAHMEEHDSIVKEVTKFLEVGTSSLNERQEF